ncbi:hypothetical protein A3K63_02440 [Candidatus Micrarchaeota archaeon RBG_16_49_10]|nr:MAG: hypothetical protein A3K63_02440 [Candidatus Micrarchaeota archaeon RBG_16_49_10]
MSNIKNENPNTTNIITDIKFAAVIEINLAVDFLDKKTDATDKIEIAMAINDKVFLYFACFEYGATGLSVISEPFEGV